MKSWGEEQTERNKLLELLKAAKCPNCSGNGKIYWDDYGDITECQWCAERKKLLGEIK